MEKNFFMKSINTYRKNIRIDGEVAGDYVLYWMQINRRLNYNYALEYAVAYANKMERPLVILEGLACDYPWAAARTSLFILEGMAEHAEELGKCSSPFYLPYPEEKPGEYLSLLHRLCGKAAILISDEYPVFLMRERNEKLQKELSIPFHTIDSNGVIPMALSSKAPYSAFIFRKTMQRFFSECYGHPPEKDPLKKLKKFEMPALSSDISDARTKGLLSLSSAKKRAAFVKRIFKDDNTVPPLLIKGTRKEGLDRLEAFTKKKLLSYAEGRNHPDKEGTSRLSPWLHFGKIAVFEILESVFSMQPEGWSLSSLTPVNGKRDGFFGGDPSIEAFLDEVITWRETGFHFAYHSFEYDQFESLPAWARKTLSEHAKDPRPAHYSYEALAASQTEDDIWNAAQTQLRREGYIHNYLRMLWGKKVLEWTPDPQTALQYLIDLNNYYAIDGRDPNSYSGIFWIFGRFDRAWGPERPIYGKIRYMTSESTRKKIKMENYLERYKNDSIR